jgi:uncharacterized phage protein (TIGR02218 family)
LSFDSLERSAESSAPIELYTFVLGATTYRFTTEPVAFVLSGNTFDPVSVKRDSVAFDNTARTDIFKVTVPATHALVRQYINNIPGARATMTLQRIQRADTPTPTVLQLQKGSLKSVGFAMDGLTAEIAVMPISGDLTKVIPRFVFGQQCNHFLYDIDCKVDPNLFKYSQSVTAGGATTSVTVQGLNVKGNGWADAGYLALATGDYRAILSQTGDVCVLMFPFPSDITGQTVDVFAGCDHSPPTCATKFVNLANNGGYPWVPTRNIFQVGLK